MTPVIDYIDDSKNILRFVFFPKTLKANKYLGKIYGKFFMEAGIFLVLNSDTHTPENCVQEIGEIYSESGDLKITIEERYEKINRPFLIGQWSRDNLIFSCYGQQIEVKEYSDLTTELFNELNKWLCQWYLKNPEMQKCEIQEMLDIKPDAKYGYLGNGKMYWKIRLFPIICGNRKDWTIFIVYHDSHPLRDKYGCTINVYPVKPNAEEILKMINEAGISSTTIPNTIKDCDGLIQLSVETIEWTDQSKVITAAKYLINAMRWISFFELGLIDNTTWAIFSGYKSWQDNDNIDLINQVSFSERN